MMDVYGPVPEESLAGSKYAVAIVDSYTRMVFLSTMKQHTASSILEIWQRFISTHVAPRKLHVYRLRTDNATEFCSEAFTTYLWRSGTAQEFSSPYTPQQMGLVESVWKPLSAYVRIMIHDTKLPEALWAEFMHTKVHLRNRLPMLSNPEHQSPYKMWFGNEPDLSHLRIIGSTAYVHEERAANKLQPSSWRGVLVGYNHEGHLHNSISYRVFDAERGKVYVSRNVTFIEPIVTDDVDGTDADDGDDSDAEDDADHTAASDLPITSGDTPTTSAQPPSTADAQPPEAPASSSAALQSLASADSASSRPPTLSSSPSSIVSVTSQAPAQESSNAGGVRFSNSISVINDAAPPAQDVSKAVRMKKSKRSSSLPPVGTSHTHNLRSRREKPSALTADQLFLLLAADYSSEMAFVAATSFIPRDAVLPKTHNEAMRTTERELWAAAEQDEIASLKAFGVFEWAAPPPGTRIHKSKWVYALKRNAVGDIIRCKARFVACGYSQVQGYDYTDAFAPVARMSTYRACIAYAAQHTLNIRQLDVKTAFLQSDLQEELST